MKWVDDCRKQMHKGADSIGNLLVEGFHYLGLFAIGGG
ncbi:MAG TPA: phosphate-starvation-inducible protein PsiE, partial [Pseudomonas sp.]|nr:phosphate-starvation-inducible protein PsiE [Pseudomonas sp.]